MRSIDTGSQSSALEEVVALSPFQVEASQDTGYDASNAISGTRLNEAIRKIPLSLEVVTSDFIRDTGAIDLRESLQYSAGVVLESQYDGLASTENLNDLDWTSSGEHHAEGITRAPHGSTVKIRGFATTQSLREGFRRQQSSDTANIDRVEILRGPSALLYGIGSLGGVVNYLVKRPTRDTRYSARFTMGSWDLKRAKFDASGQFNPKNELDQGYRVTGSWQSNSDYGDGTYQRTSWFVAPVFTFQLPNKTTSLTLDTEFGEIREQGIGFNSVRVPVRFTGESGNEERSRRTFLVPGGGTPNEKDPRTWRWSGPDSWRHNPSMNILADVQQQFGANTWLRAGVQYSHNEFNGRNVRDASVLVMDNTRWSHGWYLPPQTEEEQHYIGLLKRINPVGSRMDFNQEADPARYDLRIDLFNQRPPDLWLGDTFEAGRIEDYQPPFDTEEGAFQKVYDHIILQYRWGEQDMSTDTWQTRIEFVHNFELLHSRNTLLLGVQTRDASQDRTLFGFDSPVLDAGLVPEHFNLTSISNPKKIRIDVQGDATTPSVSYGQAGFHTTNISDRGAFAVLQSRLLEDRVNLVLGARWDETRQTVIDYTNRTDRTTAKEGLSTEEFSPQIGISWEVRPGWNLYGLYSTGIDPNYYRLSGDGSAAPPTNASNIEIGVKFDLKKARLSGTISAFRIQRDNIARTVWWAPSPGIPAPVKGRIANYDPDIRAAVSNTGYHHYIAFLLRNNPDFALIDRAAYEAWHGIPADPRDPTVPYGMAGDDVSGSMRMNTP